jgi:hypothetical protein
METAEQSPCLRFAREFLPVVNNALAEVHGSSEPGEGQAENYIADEEPRDASESEDIVAEEAESPASTDAASEPIDESAEATEEPAAASESAATSP